MKRSIYIFSSGEIKRKQNTLYFENEQGKKKYIPIEATSEILIFGEVTINKKLLEYLTQKEIIMHFFNHHGYYVGTYYPREHYNSGMIILKQAEHYIDLEKRLDLAKRFVKGAARNILKVLTYYLNRGVQLEDVISQIDELMGTASDRTDTNELLAVEGNTREIYYSSFDKITNDPEFEFSSRTRQPPRNRINALISFGNSLIYVAVLSEIYKTHLDPRIGFLHATNFRRFTLNLDVAEIFKPIVVDRLIFTLINKKMIQKNHFKSELGGIFLNDYGRRVFIEEWEKRLNSTIHHRGLKRNVSYRRLIRLELYKIEKHLLGDSEYHPFVARW